MHDSSGFYSTLYRCDGFGIFNLTHTINPAKICTGLTKDRVNKKPSY